MELTLEQLFEFIRPHLGDIDIGCCPPAYRSELINNYYNYSEMMLYLLNEMSDTALRDAETGDRYHLGRNYNSHRLLNETLTDILDNFINECQKTKQTLNELTEWTRK